MDTWNAHAVQFLLDVTLDAVIVVDDTGRITSCNPAATRLLGLDEEDVAGETATDVLDEDVDSGALRRALAGDRVDGAWTVLVRDDGSGVPVRLQGTAVNDHVMIVLHDETEDVETQAALADVRERLRDVQILGNVGLWRWVPATDEVQWSEQLYRIHDVDPMNFDGTLASHVSRIREDRRDEIRAALLETANEGFPFEAEYVVVRGNGQERWVYSRADPLLDGQGDVVALTGIVQDVTADRVARSEVESANSRLERFASVLAHDLRSPLVAIAGFADLLSRDDALEGDAAEYAGHIREGANRALDLLNSILTEAQRRTDEPATDVDLTAVVAWVIDTLAGRIEQTGSTVTTGDLPHVRGHEALLRQALLNLVGNALKFHRQDAGGTVRVTAVDVDEDVELRVEDDGPGVPKEERDLIFEDGYRVERDVERGIDGTGIGLATVAEIARRHGTSVVVSDSDLGGACFAIRLRPARESSSARA